MTGSTFVSKATGIEGLNKILWSHILITEAYFNSLPNKEDFNFRDIGIIQVKGKQEAMGIYECFDGDSKNVVQKKIGYTQIFPQWSRTILQKRFSICFSFIWKRIKEKPGGYGSPKLLEAGCKVPY